MSWQLRLRRIGLMLAAPVLALVLASLLVTVLLIALGKDPGVVLNAMVEEGKRPGNIVDIINRSIFLYIAALAVAVGFRMNLFNIGVDGQYRLAAFLAAAVGGAIALPAPLHVGVILIVAMAVGAAWAGIAAVLKVTRGVSEVLSTIMLNAIATAVIAYLLRDGLLGVTQGNDISTKPIPSSGWFPSLDPIARPIITAISNTGALANDQVAHPKLPASKEVYGFLVVAIILGVLYAVLVNRTRFGFDLRATGSSPTAAVASGVSVKRMVITSMLLSGAVAGLIGMPELLEGRGHSYSLNFPTGIGFTGIAVALLGRNNPIGMALAAILWGWVDVTTRSLGVLDKPNDTSDKVASIIQALIVFCVVIAYVVVNRWSRAAEARQVASDLASGVDLSSMEPVAVGAGSRAGTASDVGQPDGSQPENPPADVSESTNPPGDVDEPTKAAGRSDPGTTDDEGEKR